MYKLLIDCISASCYYVTLYAASSAFGPGSTPDTNCLTKILDVRTKIPKNGRNIFVLKMFKIHFPGLRTLRIAIWTRYFQVFPIRLCIFLNFWGTIFGQSLRNNCLCHFLKAILLAYFVKLTLSGLVGAIPGNICLAQSVFKLLDT